MINSQQLSQKIFTWLAEKDIEDENSFEFSSSTLIEQFNNFGYVRLDFLEHTEILINQEKVVQLNTDSIVASELIKTLALGGFEYENANHKAFHHYLNEGTAQLLALTVKHEGLNEQELLQELLSERITTNYKSEVIRLLLLLTATSREDGKNPIIGVSELARMYFSTEEKELKSNLFGIKLGQATANGVKATMINIWLNFEELSQEKQIISDFGVEEADVLFDQTLEKIRSPKQLLDLITNDTSSNLDFAKEYLDSLAKAGLATILADGSYEINAKKISSLPYFIEQEFILRAKSLYPDIQYAISNLVDSIKKQDVSIELQQVLINKLLDPQAKIFFNQAGAAASLEEYFKEVYQESVEIIKISVEKLSDQQINDIATILTNEQQLSRFLSLSQDLPIATVLIRKNGKEITVLIISSVFEEYANAYAQPIKDNDVLHPIFINNKLNRRSLFDCIATITHEVDHAVNRLAKPKQTQSDIEEFLNYIFDSSRFDSDSITYLSQIIREHSNFANETERNLSIIIGEMGGERASTRFLQTFSNGLKKQGLSNQLIGAIDFTILNSFANRAASINKQIYKPYALGMVLGEKIEAKYGSTEFLRIIHDTPSDFATLLFKDAFVELESRLKQKAAFFNILLALEVDEDEKLIINLNDFDKVIPQVQIEEELPGNINLLQTFSAINEINIFIEVAKLMPSQPKKWQDVVIILKKIISHLSSQNKIFIDYVKNSAVSEIRDSDIENLKHELEMLFRIYKNDLPPEITSSQDLRKIIFSIAFKKTAAKFSFDKEINEYQQELNDLLSQLFENEMGNFSYFTGQDLSLPIILNEAGIQTVDLLKFQELKKKILLEIKYKDYFLNRLIEINLTDNPSFAEAEQRFKTVLNSINVEYQPLQIDDNELDQLDFSSLCSDCNQVRLDTQAGVEKANALMQEVEALLQQAQSAKNDNNSSLANDLTIQAAAKKQAALQQLNDTRLQVVNSHGMQNQCVQLYLNAWVDTREAEIRQTKADITRAITSVYQATLIAKQILASKQMTIVTKPGFLSIGRQTETLNLTPQEISDVNDLLEGNQAAAIVGLKQMAEFEEKAGKLNRNKLIGGVLQGIKNVISRRFSFFTFFDQARILKTDASVLLKRGFTQNFNQEERNSKLNSYITSVLDLDKKMNLIPLSQEIALNSTDHIQGNWQRSKEEVLEEIRNILNAEHYNTRFLSTDDEMVRDIQTFVDQLADLINQERAEAGKEPLPKAKVYVSLNQGLNAFALPDGSLVVNQGLINALETKDQLFAILVHEFSHFEDNFLNWNDMLSELTSGRAQEYKADRTSLLRLGRLGYQAKAFQGAAEIIGSYSDNRTAKKSFWGNRGV